MSTETIISGGVWIQELLKRRKAKDPLYSTHIMAREIEISQTLISLIMNGKRPLSLKIAKKIIPKLKLTPQEEEQLLEVVSEEQKLRKQNRKKREHKPSSYQLMQYHQL